MSVMTLESTKMIFANLLDQIQKVCENINYPSTNNKKVPTLAIRNTSICTSTLVLILVTTGACLPAYRNDIDYLLELSDVELYAVLLSRGLER